MNIERLYQILANTTVHLRKGEMVEGTPALVEQINSGAEKLEGGGTVEIYAMPSAKDAPPKLELIDLEFIVVGVDKEKAEEHQAELINILKSYPEPKRLADGPSYIEVGGVLGDQGAAFQLFALGKVLGLWDVITPARLGFAGAEARQMAGVGFVMMSGYKIAA